MPTYEMLVLFSNSSCEVYQKDCRGKENERAQDSFLTTTKKKVLNHNIQEEWEQQYKAAE